MKERRAMKKVVIRRCPECVHIGARAREVESALRRVRDLAVEVADGGRGEFTVLVDGQEVISASGALPTVDRVLTAVEDAALAKQTV
jgi:hypothetical protein